MQPSRKGRNCILSRRRDHLPGAKQSGMCIGFTTTSTSTPSTFQGFIDYSQTQASWNTGLCAIGHVLECRRPQRPAMARASGMGIYLPLSCSMHTGDTLDWSLSQFRANGWHVMASGYDSAGDPQPRALALQAGLIQCILALRGLLPPESLQQPTRSHDAANMAGTSGAPSHTSTATCQSYQRPSAHLTLKQVSAEHKRQVREHKKSRAASAIREISSSQRPILDYRTSALSC